MKKSVFGVSLWLLPTIVFAQGYTATAGNNLTNLVTTAGNILNSLIPVLITLALVVFFWGLIKYISSSGEGHGEGRNIMIAGIVALFIMVSIWGIIGLAQNTLLGGAGNQTITAPQVQ